MILDDHAEESYEFIFRVVIEKIANYYEWDQCNKKFYESVKQEWPLLEEIITHESVENNPMWTEESYKNLFRKLWNHLMPYQRRTYFDNLYPIELEIVKDCISFNEIQNLSNDPDLRGEEDLLDKLDPLDKSDLEI